MSLLINGNGALPSALSLMATNQQQAEAFEKADKDGNGSLDNAELQTFINLISRMSRESVEAKERIAAVDRDGSNSLDAPELQPLLDSLENATGTRPFSAASLIAALDNDADGAISQTEFEEGREKVEEMLGLPSIRPDLAKAGTSETAPSSSPVELTGLLDKLLANYLGNLDGGRPSAMVSLLA